MFALALPSSTSCFGPSLQPCSEACPATAAWLSLQHLEGTYPGFRHWFWQVTVPDLGASRRLFVDRQAGVLQAVVIAKASHGERKLCTVWVAPGARGAGVATRLITEAMAWLDTERPLLTVPEERMPEFRKVVRAFGFVLEQRLDGYYRPGRAEFVFNGSLGPRR